MNDKYLTEIIDIPFSYTTFLAFMIILRYEERYSIDIDSLKEYRLILMQELVDDYSNLLDSKSLIKIKPINHSLELEKFLNTYGNIVKKVGNDLIIDKKITIKELEKIINSFNVSMHEYIAMLLKYSADCKRVLKIFRIRNLLEEYIKLESELEKYYLLYGNGNLEYENNIKKLLYERNTFYSNLLKLGKMFLEDCETEILSMTNLQEYEDKFPVDLNIFRNSIYHNPLDPECIEIGELLYSPYQCAIFDDKQLAFNRVSEDVVNLFLCYGLKNQDDDQIYYDNISRQVAINALEFKTFLYTETPKKEILFYITYIKKLDEIMIDFGNSPELINCKYRLLYLIDNLGLNLFIKDKFDNQYNNRFSLLDDSVDLQEEFENLELLAKYFILEIFEGVNDLEFLLKKIAFVGAYYEITKNHEIIDILNEFSSYPNYLKYYRLICGNQIKVKK